MCFVFNVRKTRAGKEQFCKLWAAQHFGSEAGSRGSFTEIAAVLDGHVVTATRFYSTASS